MPSPGPYLDRDVEVFVQLEAVWGTSPGALAGTDALKHTSGKAIKKVVAQRPRNQDKDYQQPSVLTTQKGREKSEFSLDCQLIPSGNATTPTAPDVDPLLEAHFGTKHTATAHTTTAAGSVGTAINFAVGGVVASGVAVGDFIVLDVSAAFGYEARQITALPGGDVVTVNAAFSADPAVSRTVKVCTTYKLLQSAKKSVHVWEFLEGNQFRHLAPGTLVQNVEGECDFANDTPAGTLKFSGEGQAEAAQTATSRPTPTTAGQPLVPDAGYAFIGATRQCLLGASFKSNNGLELRENESCSLGPSGVKRTGNDSRYAVEAMVKMLLQTGGAIEGYYDNQAALTAYDLLVQFGKTPGQIFGWRCSKFIPSVPAAVQDGEVSLEMSGTAFGTVGDDEIAVFFG